MEKTLKPKSQSQRKREKRNGPSLLQGGSLCSKIQPFTTNTMKSVGLVVVNSNFKCKPDVH